MASPEETVLGWINSMGGPSGRSSGGSGELKAPHELIDEKLVTSAMEAFSTAANAVVKGILRVGDEFANILGFRSGAARSTKVTLINQTPFHLIRTEDWRGGGIWMKGMRPAETIEPGKTVVFGSESNGFATGTEASVDYRICGLFEGVGAQDIRMGFKLWWSNPYGGGNEIKHTWPYGDASNPFWNKFGIQDPSNFHGDNSEIQFILKYYPDN